MPLIQWLSERILELAFQFEEAALVVLDLMLDDFLVLLNDLRLLLHF